MEVDLHWVYMGQETKFVHCVIGSECSHEKCLVRFLHETGKMQVVTQPSEGQDQCCHAHMWYFYGFFMAYIAQQSCTHSYESLFMTTHRSKKNFPC